MQEPGMNEDFETVAAPASFAFEVDSDIFDEVLEVIGADQVGASVKIIVADIGHLIEHLNVGGSVDAVDAVGREAHSLGGGCRSTGFVSIGAVCARIEADARARVDNRWPAYAVELAHQRDALGDWWSTAAINGGPRSGSLE
jgi:hypothetical protein